MENQFAVPGEFKPVSFPLVMNQQLRVASQEFFGVDFRYRCLADRLGLGRLGLFVGHEELNRVFSPDTLRSEEVLKIEMRGLQVRTPLLQLHIVLRFDLSIKSIAIGSKPPD